MVEPLFADSLTIGGESGFFFRNKRLKTVLNVVFQESVAKKPRSALLPPAACFLPGEIHQITLRSASATIAITSSRPIMNPQAGKSPDKKRTKANAPGQFAGKRYRNDRGNGKLIGKLMIAERRLYDFLSHRPLAVSSMRSMIYKNCSAQRFAMTPFPMPGLTLARRTLLPLAALFLLGGCTSFTDDPRNTYRPDLWWLGAESPNSMRWPAREIPDLPPMPVESIPERGPPAAQPSPGWPPL